MEGHKALGLIHPTKIVVDEVEGNEDYLLLQVPKCGHLFTCLRINLTKFSVKISSTDTHHLGRDCVRHIPQIAYFAYLSPNSAVQLTTLLSCEKTILADLNILSQITPTLAGGGFPTID